MAVGDDALLVGYPLVADTDDKKWGAREINRTRDFAAQNLLKINQINSRRFLRNAAPATGKYDTQGGIVKIRGNNTPILTKAISFAVPFLAIPALAAPNYHGYRLEATGAYDDDGLVTAGAIKASANGTTLNGTTLTIALDSGVFASTVNFYVSFIAFGLVA